MPFRRVRPPTDLERVARIIRERPGGGAAGDGGDAALLGAETDALDTPGHDGGSGSDAADEGGAHGAWLPGRPGGRAAELTRRVKRAMDQGVPRPDDASRLETDLRRARRPALLTLPDAVRDGRRSVSSAAIVALLALVVAVGCAFVLRVLWAERSAGPAVAPGGSGPVVVGGTPIASGVGTAGPARDGSGPTGSFPSSGPSGLATAALSAGGGPGSEVVVHVVGRVARPGVVRLRQGARVADAITKAGGASRGADLGALNLARLLVDGEQVRVPKVGEAIPAPAGPASAGGGSPRAGPAGVPAGAGAGGNADGPAVSLNSADLPTLDSLPGVGPVLAQRIVDWRTAHGRFSSVDELGEVSGIGDKLMAQLRPRVTL